MLLHLTELSPEPLHSQISRQIRVKILSGDISSSTPLPSIRALASQLHVSVVTVQRAYEALEREGLIQSLRGRGFYVAPLTVDDKRAIARRRLAETLKPVIDEAIAAGLRPEWIFEIVEDALRNRVNDYD